MADLYGSNYKKHFVNVPSQKIAPGEVYGRVRVAYEEYDLSVLGVVLAVNDVIYGPKLPAGAKVLDAVVQMPDLGGTGIVDLGYLANGVDAADPNGFVDQADGGAAASIKSAKDTAGGTAGLMKEFSVETQVVATCTEISVNTAGVIKFFLLYVVD